MGQKTHPIGFRLGIIKTWSSRWFETKNYAKWLHEDLKLKDFITRVAFSDAAARSTRFPTVFVRACTTMSPLMEFLTKALRLAW